MPKYDEAVLLGKQKEIDDALLKRTDENSICHVNAKLLTKISDIIQYGVNLDCDCIIMNHILQNNEFAIDVEDLSENLDKYLYDVNKINLLLNLLDRSRKPEKTQEEDLLNILIAIFRSSLTEDKKVQVADIFVKFFPSLEEKYPEIAGLHTQKPSKNQNYDLIANRRLASLKTNGFFNKDIFHIDKHHENDKKTIEKRFLREYEKYSMPNNDIGEMQKKISGLFQITDEELSTDNFIKKAQLKKMKIFLLLKTIQSHRYKNSNAQGKIQLINDIVNKKITDVNTELLSTFGEKCNFDSSVLIENEIEQKNESSLQRKDIVNTLSVTKKEVGTFFRLSMENVINMSKDCDEICFINIGNGFNDKNDFYVKNIKNDDNEKKIYIYYNDSQRDFILSSLYAHKDLCSKVSNKNSENNEINDFLQVVNEVSSDPMKANSFKDIYIKFFIHERLKALGSVKNANNFPINENSSENFIRMDCSRHVVSTSILLDLLKFQANSKNPLRDLSVTVSDIENLPQMLEEYYDYITKQNNGKTEQFTPVVNLIVQSTKILKPEDGIDFLQRINRSKKCFKFLKINDKSLFELSNLLNIKNNNIIYGYNGNYVTEENIKTQLRMQNADDIFPSTDNSAFVNNLKRIGGDGELNKPSLDNYSVKVPARQRITEMHNEIKKHISNMHSDQGEIGLELTTETDIDVDLELLLALNKKPPIAEGISDKDCITADNISKKMVELLQPDNKRLSEDTKKFLHDFLVSLETPLSNLFIKLVNRDSISEVFVDKEFNGSNFRLSPEAFIHLLNDYIRFGSTKWNGLFGDPELNVYQLKGNNGSEPMFVVSKSKTTENTSLKNPINEMFTAFPINNITTNNAILATKHDGAELVKKYNELSKLIRMENIKKVFLQHPSHMSYEYLSYVSKHSSELSIFLQNINKNNGYARICDAVCSNFCQPQKIGKLQQKFSIINPVTLSRGLNRFFDFLETLKKQNFIDDNFISQLPSILTKNKYAIQNIYYILNERRIKVAKSIIIDRINLGEKINVDVNDPKSVLKYIKHNPIRTNDHWETNFVKNDFQSVLQYNDQDEQFKYGQDVRIVDSEFDSGSPYYIRDLTKYCEIIFDENGKITSYEPKQKHNDFYQFYADLANLLLLMNKKYQRLPDGTIDDINISSFDARMIQDKVYLMTEIYDNMAKGKIINLHILVYALKQAQKQQNPDYDEIIKCYKNIKLKEENILEECHEVIMNNKDYALIALKSYSEGKGKELFDKFREIDEGKIFQDFATLSSVRRLKEFLSKVAQNGYERIGEINDEQTLLDSFEAFKNADQNSYERIIYDWFFSNTAGLKRKDELMMQLGYDSIARPDLAFEKCFNIQYQYTEEDAGDDKLEYLKLLKYCIATNNNGPYSILNDAEKKQLSENTIDATEQLTCLADILSNFKSGRDKLSFIKNISFCSRLGFPWSKILNIYQNISKKHSARETIDILHAVQSLYIMSKTNNQQINIQDILLFAENLKDNYQYNFINRRTGADSPYFKMQKDKIMIFLSSTMMETNQKLSLLKSFIVKNGVFNENFTAFTDLLSSFEDQKNKIKQNKDFSKLLSMDDLRSLFAKSVYNYTFGKITNCNKFNDNIELIFRKYSFLFENYKSACETNDIDKQGKIINICGKFSFLLKNRSIDDLVEIFNIIGDNLTTDDNILNKIEYINEHLSEESLSYEQINEIYKIDIKENFLNTGFTHEQLLSIARYKQRLERNKNELTNELNECEDEIIGKIKSDLADKKIDIQDNELLNNVGKKVSKIKNQCTNIVDYFYSNDTDSEKLFKTLNKKYASKANRIISSEQLGRTENLVLLDEILTNGNTGGYDNVNDEWKKKSINSIKNTIEYLNQLTRVFAKNQNLTDRVFNDLNGKVRKGKANLTDQEKIQLIATFCAKHIKDQNKALHIEQIAAVLLESFATSGLDNEEQSGGRKICKLGTGVGKTLTILFDMYNASINKEIPIALTTNELLVQEMINTAEENSIYKGHIYYLNSKQELVEKSTNRIVPVNEIYNVLNDPNNLFFATYSDFSFWRKKLLLNDGEKGSKIAQLLLEKGHLSLDEVDSIADAKLTNKISTPAENTSGMIKLKIMQIIQEYYDDCKKSNLLQEISLDDLLGKKTDKLKNIIKFNSNGSISLIDAEMLTNLLNAYVTASMYEDGKDFIVDSLEDGNVIYPIQGGVPNKSGAKYEQDVDLALKVRLQKEGYHFKNITSQSQIVSENINFNVFNYVKSAFGVSGTIAGGKEIWGKHGFSVNNLQSTFAKLLKTNKQPYSVCVKRNENYINHTLDMIFLLESLQDQEISKDQLKNILAQKLRQEYTNAIDNDEKASIKTCFNNLDEIISNRSTNPNYCLTILENSNELEAYKKRLEDNLDYVAQHIPSIRKPEIISLDKKTQIVDNFSIKDKLSKQNNVFVFALQEYSRGFDFPNSPHVIATSVTTKELSEQICGRTARNDREGHITYAYSVNQQDYQSLKKNENEKITDKDIQTLMEEKTKKTIDEFEKKNKYYELCDNISDKIAIFFSKITKNCPDKLDEIKQNTYPAISDFNKIVKDKFDEMYNQYLEEKKTSLFGHDTVNFNKKFSLFKQQVNNDLRNLYKYIYSCSYVEEGKRPESLNSIIEQTEKTHKCICNNKIYDNDKIKGFDPQNIKAEERQKNIKEQNETIDIYDKRRNKKTIKIKNIHDWDADVLTFIGSLDFCNYDEVSSYCLEKDFDQAVKINAKTNKGFRWSDDTITTCSSLLIAKKKILTKDEHNVLNLKERAIARCDIEYVLDKQQKIEEKLSSLPPDALIILSSYQQSSRCFIPVIITKNKLKNIDKENFKIKEEAYKTFRDFVIRTTADTLDEKYISQMYVNYTIKYFTEHGVVPTSKQIQELFKNEFEKIKTTIDLYAGDGDKKITDDVNEDNRTALKTLYITREIESRFNSAIKTGILKANEMHCLYKDQEGIRDKLNILEDEEKTQAEILEEFRKKLEKYENCNLELTDNERKEVAENGELLSNIIFNKINAFTDDIELLKSQIDKNDTISYEDKTELQKKCTSILSKDNLSKQFSRIMRITAETARLESLSLIEKNNENIKNFDIFARPSQINDKNNFLNSLNLDNVENVKTSFKEIKDHKANAKSVSELIDKNIKDDEVILKKTLVDLHNNVVKNLNIVENNIEQIETYKKYIDNATDHVITFEKFDNIHAKMILEKIKTKQDVYANTINKIKTDAKLSPKQKNEITNELSDKNIDVLVDAIITPNNLTRLFNEFSLKNYDSNNKEDNPFYNDEAILPYEQTILNEIIKDYKDKFGKISKLTGKDGIDLEKKPNSQEEYEELVKNFKNNIKSILNKRTTEYLLNYAKDQNDNGIKENRVLLIYDFFSKFINRLNENYQNNDVKCAEMKNDIANTIISVVSSFKNIKGAHGSFKENLYKICSEMLPELKDKINVDDMLNESAVQQVVNELNNVDLSTLKQIKKALDNAVNIDINEMKDLTNIAKQKANDVPTAFKVLLIVCTFGLVLLTEKGKNMFKHKFVKNENKTFTPDIKTKEYFLLDNKKEKELNENMKNIDLSNNSGVVVLEDDKKSPVVDTSRQINNRVSNSLRQSNSTELAPN